MYFRGEGRPQDIAEGWRLLRLAATQGHAEAQYDLGITYISVTKGGQKDDVEARRLLRLSAAQGHAGALAGLGIMYSAANGYERLIGTHDDVATASGGDGKSWRYLVFSFQIPPQTAHFFSIASEFSCF